ncbi:MAG: S41 family peptidase [Candidatus Thorarchaeota archaeon]
MSWLKPITVSVFLAMISIPVLAHGEDWYHMSREEIITAAREKAVVTRPYKLDVEIEVDLAMEQIALLNVEPNPHGLEQVVLSLSAAGGRETFWHLLIFEDGYVKRHGVFMQAKGTLLPEHTQCPDLGPYIRCDTDGGTVHIKYRLLGGKEKRFRLKRKLRQSKGKGHFISQEDRLAAFVKLWSEVKYNFAFFDQVPDVDWDEVLQEYLPKVLEEQSLYDYDRLLKRLIVSLQDGHTRVRYLVPGEGDDVCMDYVPLRAKSVGGKIIIIEPGRNDEISKAGLQTGDEITHIDGRPVKEILEQDVYPYIFASTAQDRDRKAFQQNFECSKGPIDSKARLRIRTVDGDMREVSLTRRTRGIEMPWLRRPRSQRSFRYKELEDGIAYVGLGSFSSKEIVKQFDEAFDKIQKAKGLVIDVRENGGGSTSVGYAIISYLTDKTLEGSRWKTRQYMPAFRAWGAEEKWYEGSHGKVEPRIEGSFLGPIVVLIDSGTYSAAEDFVVVLHAGGRATLVGEKTAGSTGQPLEIDLPGDGWARICTKRDTYPDGREFVGVGIIPDVEVWPTPKDIAADKDVVLEKGVEVLRSKLESVGALSGRITFIYKEASNCPSPLTCPGTGGIVNLWP